MGDTHKVDIAGLEKKVTALSDALARLSQTEDLKHLILVMKKPGWTTPAEFLFASSIIDALQSQVASLANLKSSLVKGSEAVAAK
jgi:hypothetical protein